MGNPMRPLMWVSKSQEKLADELVALGHDLSPNTVGRLLVDELAHSRQVNRTQFVASPWARRAADLGWDADELFGSRFSSPHEHLGSSGLLWNLGGGRLVQLYRDGAAFVTEDGRERTFHRRPHRVMTFLPWS
jgi:hypothetical protein